MVYKATTQRTMLVFFLIFLLWSIFLNRHYPAVYYLLIPFSLFTLVTIFTHFQFCIGDDYLTFKISILTLTIYKKETYYNQINHFKFKRTGWARKCVLVHNKKGFNFRTPNFNSATFYNNLINFANRHKIPVFNIKDYLIVEKLK